MTNSKVHSFAIAQHLYIFVIVFLLQLYSVLTYKWIFFDEANKTPNPQDKNFFGVCGVSSSSYLCDPDRILTVKGRQRVSQRLQLLEKQTANVIQSLHFLCYPPTQPERPRLNWRVLGMRLKKRACPNAVSQIMLSG